MKINQTGFNFLNQKQIFHNRGPGGLVPLFIKKIGLDWPKIVNCTILIPSPLPPAPF